ncbi:MAG: hypothetical protein AAGD10_06805 [Myxococcota bacterium]
MKRPLWILCAFALACSEDSGTNGTTPDMGPMVSCVDREDCEEGERCEDDVCVADVCVEDGDCGELTRVCGEDQICTFRSGFADECDAERSCPFGQFCSELLGRCLDNQSARDCVRREQCPDRQICDRSANKCIPDPGCLSDAFCEPDEICNTVRRSCEADTRIDCSPCLGDADCGDAELCEPETLSCLADGEEPPCPTGQFCSIVRFCVQCESSTDCGEGLFCNIGTGTCDSAQQCADEVRDCPNDPSVQCTVCEAPLQCNRRTQRCEAPPEPCTSDVECAEGEFCDLTLSPPVCAIRLPECLDDIFDEAGDNSDFATPTAITPGRFEELILCPGDLDIYRLEVEAGTIVTFDARFSQAAGDVEMQLFLPDGETLIASARSATDNERIRVELGSPTTLLLRVFLARPEPRAIDYSLIVTTTEGEACIDDPLEPNDAPNQTAELSVQGPIEGQVCAANPDWFTLSDVPIGSRVELELDFAPSLGDLDLEVFRSGEPTAIFRSASLDGPEALSFPATFGGDFLIRVSGKRTDQNRYSLRARVFPDDPSAVCPDDAEEPNDGPATASDVGMPGEGFPFFIDGTRSLCPGDEDWFQVPFDGGGRVLAVELSHDPGIDLDVLLYADGEDPLATPPLASGRSIGGREFFTFSDFQPQPLLLRVVGVGADSVGNYQLRVVREDAFICSGDAFDVAGFGNARGDAVDLGSAPVRQNGLTLCSGDIDFLSVSLPPGFIYDIRLEWRRQNTRLEFVRTVANGFGNLPTQVFETNPNASVLRVAPPGGAPTRLTLEPVLTLGFSSDYQIVIESRPAVDCGPDAFDPNQDETEAAFLTPPLNGQGLVLCPSNRDPTTALGDEDWYEVQVDTPSSRLEAEIRFDRSDLLLELLGPNGTSRACLNQGNDRCFSDGFDLTENIGLTVTATGTYLLRVSSFYSDLGIPVPDDVEIDTNYDLEIRVATP